MHKRFTGSCTKGASQVLLICPNVGYSGNHPFIVYSYQILYFLWILVWSKSKCTSEIKEADISIPFTHSSSRSAGEIRKILHRHIGQGTFYNMRTINAMCHLILAIYSFIPFYVVAHVSPSSLCEAFLGKSWHSCTLLNLNMVFHILIIFLCW